MTNKKMMTYKKITMNKNRSKKKNKETNKMKKNQNKKNKKDEEVEEENLTPIEICRVQRGSRNEMNWICT